MELLAILFVWPFLILAFGLVFIAFNDLAFGGAGVLLFVLAMMAVLGKLMSARDPFKNRTGPQSSLDQLKNLRQLVVILSISALLPIFIRYMFDGAEYALPIIILGLLIGFGFILWGMFVKDNKVIMYSGIIGGALSIIYVYSQLWELGGMARVIAAGFGLVVAVVVSTIKLKDKLT